MINGTLYNPGEGLRREVRDLRAAAQNFVLHCMSQQRVKIWRLKIDQVGGCGDYYHIAYLDEKVAAAEAERMKKEWTNYIPEDVWARSFSAAEAAVGRELYAIDSVTWEDYEKAQALKKLTPAERRALGL